MINFRQKLNEEKGSALLLVLVLTTVFGILGASLIYVTSVHHKNIYEDELKLQAYYAAETGIMYGLERLKNNQTFPYENDSWTNENGTTLGFEVEKQTLNPDEIKLVSKGSAIREKKYETVLSVVVGKKKLLPELVGNELFNYTAFNSSGGKSLGIFHDLYFGVEVLDEKGPSDIILDNSITLYGDTYAKRYYFNTMKPGLVKFYNSNLYTSFKNEDKKPDKDNGNDPYLEFNTANKKFTSIDPITFGAIGGSADKIDFKGDFDDIVSRLENSGKLNEVDNDIHITQSNRDSMLETIKNDYNGWMKIDGDFIIDEGIELQFNDLVVVANGILIGGTTSNQPVSLKGRNIVLVATEHIDTKWKNIAPIYYNSYRNDYLTNGKFQWDDISIIVNDNSQIEGWLIGENRVVFDYKHGDEFNVTNHDLAKVTDGIIAEAILFPPNIEIGNDHLYYYDWETSY